ncbi:hypothetical protein HGM15179_008712 [Zosterops borbonicus]|uniref:Uncharacterized protein n=1 Tax=Zosterops borbonicus TaxID=364589 RepID=A0A8K1GGJ4_9PASS|nr:hypothetical protein HGM15179_008712 [Zosterops borbonicus]
MTILSVVLILVLVDQLKAQGTPVTPVLEATSVEQSSDPSTQPSTELPPDYSGDSHQENGTGQAGNNGVQEGEQTFWELSGESSAESTLKPSVEPSQEPTQESSTEISEISKRKKIDSIANTVSLKKDWQGHGADSAGNYAKIPGQQRGDWQQPKWFYKGKIMPDKSADLPCQGYSIGGQVASDKKLHMSQLCALTAQKANQILSCIPKCMARGSKRVILPLYSAHGRSHLEYCAQFCVSNIKRTWKCVQSKSRGGHKADQRTRAPSLRTQAEKVGAIQPGEEKAVWKPQQSSSV